MGASLSNLTVDVGDGSGGPGLGDIPESCVACVFTYLTPPEICNLARLNRAFRGAASSDSVWELKLPPTYPQLLSLLPPGASLVSKKKDIFAFLSRPVPFDDRYKVLWLDRVTGGVCVSVSAKAMSITGIEDRRYWSWIPTPESRCNLTFIFVVGNWTIKFSDIRERNALAEANS
ncbi:F-box protein PP2-A15-like [Curcuma longa]|uniref:F-box protein PP2-A15-like n=1 Tax=Curcuma longa TaxID=136217 RepID=UPI003D9F9A99